MRRSTFGLNDLSGAMNRRQMLALGAAAASATLLPTLPSLAQQTPQRGGHLRFGSYGAVSTGILDPTTYNSNFLMFAGNCWGSSLVQLDGNSVLQPELAESWDMSPDGSTWVFKLRQGVEFHNGKTLTASDVVYTIARHRTPEALSGVRPMFGQMEVEATGSNEVTFRLDAPNVEFVNVLSEYRLLMQAEGEAVDAGIGTGPYVVQSHENGVRIELKRNENYWKSDAAYLDSISILGVNDNNARISALQSGDIDLVIGVPPRMQPLLEGAGYSTYRVPSSGFVAFGQDVQVAPFDNKDFRLALRYAVDREELHSSVWSGSGLIGNDHPITPAFPFFNSELPQRAHDPDLARFHFQRSGVAGNLPPLSMADSIFIGAGESAELFQQQAIRAGIDLQLQRLPTDGYWSNPNQGPFRLYSYFGRASESQMLTAIYGPGAALAAREIGNPLVQELIFAARAEADVAKRKQIYFDLQEIISEDGASIMPWHQQWELAGNSNIQGFSMNHLGDGKFLERIWLA